MAKISQNTTDLKQLGETLPDKKYFTIGEVAQLLQLKSHVLRYWEQVFPQLEPSKRRGRRYYQRSDLELVLEIKTLLHDQGFTIPGAKAKLAKKSGASIEATLDDETASVVSLLQTMKQEAQEFNAYIQQKYL